MAVKSILFTNLFFLLNSVFILELSGNQRSSFFII